MKIHINLTDDSIKQIDKMLSKQLAYSKQEAINKMINAYSFDEKDDIDPKIEEYKAITLLMKLGYIVYSPQEQEKMHQIYQSDEKIYLGDLPLDWLTFDETNQDPTKI